MADFPRPYDAVGDANRSSSRFPHPLLALGLIGLYFLLQIGVSGILVLGWLAVGGQALTEAALRGLARSGALNGATVSVAAALTFAAIYMVVRGVERLPVWPAIGFVAPRHIPAWVGAPVAIVIALALDALTSALRLPVVPRALLDLYGEQGVGLLILIAAVVLIGPFAEEVLFRGLLYGSIEGRFGPAAALAVTSLLFGLIHFCTYGTEWYPVAQTAAIGLALTGLRAWTGSIWPGLIAHTANNAYSTIQILMLLRSG